MGWQAQTYAATQKSQLTSHCQCEYWAKAPLGNSVFLKWSNPDEIGPQEYQRILQWAKF